MEAGLVWGGCGNFGGGWRAIAAAGEGGDCADADAAVSVSAETAAAAAGFFACTVSVCGYSDRERVAGGAGADEGATVLCFTR